MGTMNHTNRTHRMFHLSALSSALSSCLQLRSPPMASQQVAWFIQLRAFAHAPASLYWLFGLQTHRSSGWDFQSVQDIIRRRPWLSSIPCRRRQWSTHARRRCQSAEDSHFGFTQNRRVVALRKRLYCWLLVINQSITVRSWKKSPYKATHLSTHRAHTFYTHMTSLGTGSRWQKNHESFVLLNEQLNGNVGDFTQGRTDPLQSFYLIDISVSPQKMKLFIRQNDHWQLKFFSP